MFKILGKTIWNYLKKWWNKITSPKCISCGNKILVKKDRRVWKYRSYDDYGFDVKPQSFIHTFCYMKVFGLTDEDKWEDKFSHIKRLKKNANELVEKHKERSY